MFLHRTRYFVLSVGIIAALASATSRATPSWIHGKAEIVEARSSYVLVVFDGPNPGGCGTANVIQFDSTTLGTEQNEDRAYALVLSSAASDRPIRFFVDGCLGTYQKATNVQFCGNADCSF